MTVMRKDNSTQYDGADIGAVFSTAELGELRPSSARSIARGSSEPDLLVLASTMTSGTRLGFSLPTLEKHVDVEPPPCTNPAELIGADDAPRVPEGAVEGCGAVAVALPPPTR